MIPMWILFNLNNRYAVWAGSNLIFQMHHVHLLVLCVLVQFILKNYGENPDNYNEQLKKLETLRQVGCVCVCVRRLYNVFCLIPVAVTCPSFFWGSLKAACECSEAYSPVYLPL